MIPRMDEFYSQADRQLTALFPWTDVERELLMSCRLALDERFEGCCLRIRNKYYSDVSFISPLHSCQYAMFLYFASRFMKSASGRDMLYNLLKMVSGADIYHQVILPKTFFFDHPVGTVLGRADYGDHFMFAQGVTVGNNKGEYPVFGDCVCMNSGAKVLGRCRIGDNVIIAANAYVKDVDVPSGSIVFGQDRNLTVKTGCDQDNKTFFRRIFQDL